ncbi:hypothetical protein [Microbispora bryophytorum]|uniref:Uncharacterized protein n=1 Tax=Microbispora bryophytorum subsp. camponoti TaxID=1677852 RepID=A0ABR8LBM7_9ACTN|nr:hypothetical protein [Microbispora camponoti]MBD3145929.1 hypothetical protein [Microbispora camponoti]
MSERSERISGRIGGRISGHGAPGVPPDPFPGGTHWYDLPDDDATPEGDEGGVSGWWVGRWLR